MIFFTSSHVNQAPSTPYFYQNTIQYKKPLFKKVDLPYPSKTIQIKHFFIDFENTNQKYPEFHIQFKDFADVLKPFIKYYYNFYININDAQVFIPHVSFIKENIFLLNDYLTHGTLSFANHFKISIFIANIDSTNPANDPKTFIKTYKYNMKYNYDLSVNSDDLLNNEYDLKIPYLYDLVNKDISGNKFYIIKLKFPNDNFYDPQLLKNIVDINSPNNFLISATGQFIFDNTSIVIKNDIENKYLDDDTQNSKITFGNKSYYDWKNAKIKLGTNPDGPTFNGIALPPDSGKHVGIVKSIIKIKNNLFDISITMTNKLKVQHSIINGPDALYNIKHQNINTKNLKYQDKFLFLLKDLDKILSGPINEETIWKYKEKI